MAVRNRDYTCELDWTREFNRQTRNRLGMCEKSGKFEVKTPKKMLHVISQKSVHITRAFGTHMLDTWRSEYSANASLPAMSSGFDFYFILHSEPLQFDSNPQTRKKTIISFKHTPRVLN